MTSEALWTPNGEVLLSEIMARGKDRVRFPLCHLVIIHHPTAIKTIKVITSI